MSKSKAQPIILFIVEDRTTPRVVAVEALMTKNGWRVLRPSSATRYRTLLGSGELQVSPVAAIGLWRARLMEQVESLRWRANEIEKAARVEPTPYQPPAQDEEIAKP